MGINGLDGGGGGLELVLQPLCLFPQVHSVEQGARPEAEARVQGPTQRQL